jgi:cytochrome P450
MAGSAIRAGGARSGGARSGGARSGGAGSGGGGTLIEDLPGGFGAGVLLNMMDDPRHQRIRKLVTPAVAPRALARMEPELRARTEAIVDAAVERGSCDFLLDVAAELPLHAIARLLGVPQEDRHRLFGWAEVTLDHDDHDLGESTARQQEASAAMFAYGADLLAEKRRCPGDDLLSAIATAELPTAGLPGGSEGEIGPLTDLEQQMCFNLLIAAGSETTPNTIAVGLLGLLAHPDHTGLRHLPVTLVPAPWGCGLLAIRALAR